MVRLHSFKTTMFLAVVVFSILVDRLSCSVFPPHFKFGAATSSYQIEGAWNVSDKGVSIWDHYTHTKPYAIDGTNGDVACDSYFQWKRDVEMAKDLGLQHYRFSINWPRLLPKGLPPHISQDGKNYYNNLINELLKNGIEPLVTIYHWELPQRLQDLGGWTNPLITDWYADYARIVFSLFADRVKTWITLNEPLAICDAVYNMGILAPALVDVDFANYICTKNVMIAHAKAYRIYDQEFRAKYDGKVSVSNSLMWLEPAAPGDEEITELASDYYSGRYIHPIYSKEGGWPPAFEDIIAKKSKKEGYSRSRLPAFTKEEIELVKGTYDFFGINYYTSRLVKKADPKVAPSFLDIPELGIAMVPHPDWKPGFEGSWMYIHHPGIRKQMSWLRRYDPELQILITETGFPMTGSLDLDDDERVKNMRDSLEQVLLSIEEDGVNVIGYTLWSLMDNYEWIDGYTTHFGLYEVDFTDPRRARTPRKSAQYYKNVIRSRSIDINWTWTTRITRANKGVNVSYRVLNLLIGVLLTLCFS